MRGWQKNIAWGDETHRVSYKDGKSRLYAEKVGVVFSIKRESATCTTQIWLKQYLTGVIFPLQLSTSCALDGCLLVCLLHCLDSSPETDLLSSLCPLLCSTPHFLLHNTLLLLILPFLSGSCLCIFELIPPLVPIPSLSLPCLYLPHCPCPPPLPSLLNSPTFTSLCPAAMLSAGKPFPSPPLGVLWWWHHNVVQLTFWSGGNAKKPGLL